MEVVLGALGASRVVFWSNFHMLMCGVGSRELSEVPRVDFWSILGCFGVDFRGVWEDLGKDKWCFYD